MPAFRPPGDCPNCDEPVPSRARACPHCGATAADGWNQPTGHEGLDLPEDDTFDYDDFAEREFGVANRNKPANRRWLWPTVALVLAVILLWLAFGGVL